MNFSLENFSLYFAVRAFRKSRAKFYSDLADALKDNELLSKFVAIRKARAIKQKDPLAPLYSLWLRRMQAKGGKLSHVLQGSAPAGDILVLAAIEDKGELPEGLKFLASTIKDQNAMRSSLSGAVAMPAVAVVIMLAFLVILSVHVIPVFAEIAPPDKWSAIGKVLYFVSRAVTGYGIFMLIGFAALCGWFIWSLPNWTGPRRTAFDRYLPYRIYRDYHGSVFLVSLATMMQAGDTLARSLETLKKRASPWLRWHINKILVNMQTNAGNYGEAFATGVFSQELSNRLADFSRRSSEFDKVLSRIGIDGISEIRQEVETTAKKLNLLLSVIIGCVLGFMVLGIIVTAQGLSSSLREEVNMQKRI